MLKKDDLEILQIIKSEIEDAKADNIKIIDVRKISSITEFFVLCTGEVDIHLMRVYTGIRKRLIEHNMKPFHYDDSKDSGWLSLDYGFIIVHIFTPEMREYYDLDSLWIDGENLSL